MVRLRDDQGLHMCIMAAWMLLATLAVLRPCKESASSCVLGLQWKPPVLLCAGLSVLHYAVDGGHPDIVSMLLLTGQGPWPATNHSLPPAAATRSAALTVPSPGTAAINKQAGDVTSIPTSDSAATTDTAAFTPLHLAARRGHAHILPQLLRCGLDSRAVDGRGRTVLHHAALGAGEAASGAPPPPMLDVALGAGGSQPLEPPGAPAAVDGAKPAGGSRTSLCALEYEAPSCGHVPLHSPSTAVRDQYLTLSHTAMRRRLPASTKAG